MVACASWRISELIPMATLSKTLALWGLSLKGTSGIPLPDPTQTHPATRPPGSLEPLQSILAPCGYGSVSFQPAVELHPGWCSQGPGTSTPAEQDPDNLRVSWPVGMRGSFQIQGRSDDL